MDDVLNQVLDIDPAETRHPIQQAADIIDAEAIVTLSPATVPAVVPSNTVPAPKPERDQAADDLDDDVDFAREQMKLIIDDGRSALNGIMELAAAGDEPRAYEVVAELMTATVAANRELINLHEVRKKAKKADAEAKAKLAEAAGSSGAAPAGAAINIDKAVFVGRADQLLRELRNVKKQTAVAIAEQSELSHASES